MVLTALPCIDTPPDNVVNQTEQSQDSTDSHQNEKDNCSPFCACQCCAVPAIFTNVEVQFTRYAYPQKYFLEFSKETSSANTPIWQPPKLS